MPPSFTHWPVALVAAQAGTADLQPLDVLLLLAAVLVGAAAYFLPTIVAVSRHHPNAAPVFVVNLLLGWTLVGYVAALAWSLVAIRAVPLRDHGTKQ